MKIQMKTPLVEMDGDEMTRILWKQIKDILLEPYIDLKTEYYDLSLDERERTKDQVTIDAANANKRLGVAVKCATITPNARRQKEYNLTQIAGNRQMEQFVPFWMEQCSVNRLWSKELHHACEIGKSRSQLPVMLLGTFIAIVKSG